MKTQNDEFLHIRLPSELKKQYEKYCDENGYSLSKRIRLLMEKEIKNDGNQK